MTYNTLQTTEEELLRKEHGQQASANGSAQEEVLYKIDIPANRYDMLCLEGITSALNIFNKRISSIDYRLADMAGMKLLPMHLAGSNFKVIILTECYRLQAGPCCK